MLRVFLKPLLIIGIIVIGVCALLFPVIGWWAILVSLLLLVVGLFGVFKFLLKASNFVPERELTSIVLLLEKARRIEPQELATAIERAWGPGAATFATPQELAKDQPSDLPPGMICAYLISKQDRHYSLSVINKPYIDKEESPPDFNDAAARDTFLRHNAAILIDLHERGNQVEDKDAFRDIGNLAAELPVKPLMVFTPTYNRVSIWTDEVRETFRSPEPLKVFGEIELVRPSDSIRNIPGNDPRLVAATAEAKHRWPEFVAAFNARDPDGDAGYLVKGKFYDPRDVNLVEAEQMWVAVEAIRDTYVAGTLINNPNYIGGVVAGTNVQVTMERLTDWAIMKEDGVTGAFTDAVILEYQKELVGKPL